MRKLFLFALLFAAFAGAAQAQVVWPTANPYTCDWTLNGTSGKAFVTFQYNPYGPGATTRTGKILNVYPNGTSSNPTMTLSWDFWSGAYDRLEYLQTVNNISCVVITANGGRDVTFSGCSNGAWQHCVQ